jgi:branched-chain amino acid transport system permease protein
MSLLPQLIVDALLLSGLYSLMAIGLSLSFGITRIINFSHGEAIMLGAYGSYWFLTLWGIDPLISMPFLLVLGFVGGFALFKVSLRQVLTAQSENQILLTFGIGLILQNVAVIFWSGDQRSANPPYAFSAFDIGDVVIPGGRLIGFIVAACLFGGLMWWLMRTELGRACRALAENRVAATLMGINVDATYAIAFGISVSFGVATGVVMSFIMGIGPFMGFHMLVKGFAIIILGGLGSIVGTVIGAFVLGFAETIVGYYVPDGNGWSEGVAFALLFCILIAMPRGIHGQAVEH